MDRLNNAQTFIATYTQYKEDTKYIAGWLAEASHSVGHQLHEAQTGHPRSKAKGRSNKGKNNNRNGGKSGRGGNKKYLIKVSDFVPMAEAIANNEANVLVPVTNWFKSKTLDDNNDSNERHHYFITVLEDAFRLLRPFISLGPEAHRPGKPGATSDALPLQNRFANLTVEDVAEIAEKEGAEESKLPDVSNVVFEQDEAEMEEELKFAVGLLLQELQTMRDAACAQWEKYKNDEVDLIVAAMTTDMAIKLAQRAEAEFDLVVKRPKSYPTDSFPAWKLLDALVKPSESEASQSSDDQGPSTFWPTYSGLKYYFDRIMKWDPKKNLPATVAKDFGGRKMHDYTLRAIEYSQIILIMIFADHPNVWDMVSSGVEHMFKARELPIWVSFAVQTHLASQDIMADRCAHPSFELENHLQKIIRQNNKMVEDWESPFLPEEIYQDCFYNFGEGVLDIQEWSSQDGFDKQWQALLLNKQVASHPVLKLLRKEKNYYMRHHPLLCGMMKYEMYLKKQAAGMKLEHQSLAISMMAHIYVNGRLQFGDHVPVWPDMELIIYAQDPGWLFVGGRPKTTEEARKKLFLASGSSAANSARDIPLHRLKINQNKLREFRDTMMFGSGVYLPRDKFSKSRVNVCTVHAEDLVKRLEDTVNTAQPWGRLARQLIISRSEQAQNGATKGESKSLRATSRTILESYAQWLQADMVDLYFDWLEMGFTCGEIWADMRRDLERLPTWDPTSFVMKPALEPTIDILTRDREYPRCLKIAYGKIRLAFNANPPSHFESLDPDTCLVALGKYHRATAAMLEAPGPLNLSNLYEHWQEEDWKPRWEEMKSKPANQLHDIFLESFVSSLNRKHKGAEKGVAADPLQAYMEHLMKGVSELDHVPDGPLAELAELMEPVD
ncbi:uncharacterized protein K460DRAFT_281363 [Cucurbitaria berberidis CBS 394.84]|uniref:DUF6604 domain-containing protein n=1 Tax=Cucurbitaria berberidis CBS 394.84 TaxID=1168544 RepID=A0A9P4L9U6_9PLEO|nr:uncharacterized protein K460DRAFT_281363 [Cucurbitaria berberidis CBS 394.84]KAF1847641.1 hypothetical protein K460DRAFT_281363 [Cucurbitaria berberidis CBS 394.84]